MRTHHSKTVPPFAKQLQGKRDLLVFIGGRDAAWDAARIHAKGNGRYDAVLVPIGEHPSVYDWECVIGKSVVVVEIANTGPGYRDAVVRTLAINGADEVFLMAYSRNPCDCLRWGLSS